MTTTSLKDQVSGWDRNPVKDFDPEDGPSAHADDESEIDGDTDDAAGREHYQAVEKSRLRPSEPQRLDAKYRGVAVSRAALAGEGDEGEGLDHWAPVEESDDGDPFAPRNGHLAASGDDSDDQIVTDAAGDIDPDEEIDSDEALDDADRERFKDFKFRGSKRPQQEDAELDSASEDKESHPSDEDETLESDLDMDDDDDDEEEEEEEEEDDDRTTASSAVSSSSPPPRARARNADREELKKMAFASSSTAALAAALSTDALADITKGRAVKKQRQLFDRLLDTRIKLQKGLAAANDVPDAALTDQQWTAAAQKAEDAALALWTTIDAIRCSIAASQPSTWAAPDDEPAGPGKRKQPFTATRATATADIWQQTTRLEAATQPARRATLDRWHQRTQPVLDPGHRSRLLTPSATGPSRARLTDVLATYLATESSKLAAQSTVLPSAPSLPQSHAAPTTRYDDDVFYQSLLRDLIVSRNSLSAHSDAHAYLPTKLRAAGSKHKTVDTRASKGRKVRYTVHEKLLNFMAPEDRSTWEDRARTEFFASLLGGAVGRALNEENAPGGAEEDDQGNDEVEALRLFRS